MNERIKEIARRSGATDQNGSMATTVFCFTEMELDRFAELIVQECAEVITETHWHLPPTQQQIAVGIKEHFGVE